MKLAPDQLGAVEELLKGQLAVSARDAEAAPLDATSLQLPGVLDDLYTYGGPLGVSWNRGTPTLRVWAPTARTVDLLLYADSAPATAPTVIPMTRGEDGVYSVTGSTDWKWRYYSYRVTVYARKTNKVEVNEVTDPYSLTLSRNSGRSQIVNLEDAELKPHGWDRLAKPRLARLTDISLYALHVRDFSASDPSVPERLRGTFKAFNVPSNGAQHLATLAFAGLTHVHILPAFDITSVNEDKSAWQDPGDLSAFPPDSTEQQAPSPRSPTRTGSTGVTTRGTSCPPKGRMRRMPTQLALASMGEVPFADGRLVRDFDAARFYIDLIGSFHQRYALRLPAQELHFLESYLDQLRLRYVARRG